MSPAMWLIAYCGLILLASVAGGLVPIYVTLTHRRMELVLSFVSGVMLGVGLLHLLPHAWAEQVAALEVASESLADRSAGGPDGSGRAALQHVLLWALGGFLGMFLIERFFSFHQHPAPAGGAAPSHAGHDHGAATAGDHEAHRHHAHAITWTGAIIGLTLHSLLAGIALAGSMQAAVPGGEAALAGFATFLVIFLHKPFDAMAIGALMSAGGHSPRARHFVNGLFALAIPLGALLLHAGLSAPIAGRHEVLAAALAVSAGMFMCIALSDLLPELQFHQHDRVMLSAALILGLALAWGIARLEAAGHDHDDHEQSVVVAR